MNNYHYIAIQKAASWEGNTAMQTACVEEFHAINESMDTPNQAIEAAYENGINHDVVPLFEVAL